MTRQLRKYFVSLAAALLLGACAATSPEFDAGMKDFNRGEHLLALGHWQPVADAGDADAQQAIGWLYENGLGVGQDYKTSASWYQKSVDGGHAGAALNLGNLLDNGLGLPKNYVRSFALFQTAAAAGFAEAYNNMGEMYRLGQGVEKDDREAFYLFRVAAEEDYAPAQNRVGVMLFRGQGNKQDAKEAYYWTGRAVLNGQAGAEHTRDFIRTFLTAGQIKDVERRLASEGKP